MNQISIQQPNVILWHHRARRYSRTICLTHTHTPAVSVVESTVIDMQLTPSMSMGWTMGTLACLAGTKGALAAARTAALAGVWRPKAEAPVARMQKAAVNFMVGGYSQSRKWRMIDSRKFSRSLGDPDTDEGQTG